ncbi:hypothetical protein FNX48_023550, partial [Streptomyces sp. IF17]|nr:hypothetical protein [Streptomyces alkaliphilus]
MRAGLTTLVALPATVLLVLWSLAVATLPMALWGPGTGPLLVPALAALLLVPPTLLLTALATGRLVNSLERGLDDVRSHVPGADRGAARRNNDRPGGAREPGDAVRGGHPSGNGRRPLSALLRRAPAGFPGAVSSAGPPLEIAELREALVRAGRSASGSHPTAGCDHPGGDVRRAVVNVARRSRCLVNRQLAHIDRMERRTHDPEALEELFVLDHLSTRMRRQAESLIILAGGAPTRIRSGVVPLADVVQAAIGEIEDYRRVDLIGAPRPSLPGHAATDIVHLLAELLENATRFSPVDTRVRLTDRAVPGGHLLRIEDAGPGMSPADLEAAQRRVRGPRTPGEDLPPGGDRLGLFVVGRLARRRGLLVDFRSSPHRGTTVSVLLPGALLTAPGAPSPS